LAFLFGTNGGWFWRLVTAVGCRERGRREPRGRRRRRREGDGGGRARAEQGRKAPRGLKPVSPCFSPIESIKEEKLPG